MRIAFVHPRYPSGEGTGAAHSATQIVFGLLERGHEVRVYCTRSPDEDSHREGMELRELRGHSRHPHTMTRLNREILARQTELREFDVLHSYLTPLIPALGEIGEQTATATVVTLNAFAGVCAKNDLRYRNREQCRSKSLSKCLHCVARTGSTNDEHGYAYETTSQLLSLQLITAGERRLEHVDGFQALSPHVKETYGDFGYDREKISVIPNIVDAQFDVEHESEFESPYRLLYVGSLQQSKGVDRLVDVFSRVRAQSEADVRLTVVGDGALRQSIEQQATAAGLSEVVDVRGRVPYDELPAVYASHDVFLYPGRWDEPFGRIFLEAMATGTPVVATDVGSVRDIIGNAGVVTEQTISALSEAVLDLLDGETLRQYSQVGRERIERYRPSDVIPQFEQLYSQCL